MRQHHETLCGPDVEPRLALLAPGVLPLGAVWGITESVPEPTKFGSDPSLLRFDFLAYSVLEARALAFV